MKPILFNTEMVKAILDGRKTQTRRVCGFDILDERNHYSCNNKSFRKLTSDNSFACPNCGGMQHKQCQPKYKIDDILYVRETFCIGKASGKSTKSNTLNLHIWHKADDSIDFKFMQEHNLKWTPSIHMPKKYARIFLKITNVRVERLQDINFPEDFEAEGSEEFFVLHSPPYNCNEKEIKEWWINLWNSTAKDSYKWEDNPYVFVYEFEKVDML